MSKEKMWSFLHDRIHEAHKTLKECRAGGEYHAQLDAIASNLTDSVIERFGLAEAAQSPAVPVFGELTDRQLFNVAFNLSAEFGAEFTQANKAFAMAVIDQYRHAMSGVSIAQAELDALRKDAERLRELLAESIYKSHVDTSGIHCNRFPSWRELSADCRKEWFDAAIAKERQS